MRLKQLLGVLILLLATSALCLAANSQLTAVSVAGQGNGTSVTLQASGAFTHTEYRPTDNLLLVDLAGVSPGKLKDTTQSVNRAGVASYRVLGYTGSNGAEVTRLELTLTAGAVVNVTPAAGGLQVHVSVPGEAAPAQAAAAVAPKAEPAKTAKAEAPAPNGQKVVLRHVSVLRGKGGMEVELSTSAPVTPNVLRLTSPDRIVLDLPNAVIAGRARPIVVNGREIKSVRVGRFQADPPTARVVVDLASAQDYEVVSARGGVVLKLHPAQAQAQPEPKPDPPAPLVLARAEAPAAPPKLPAAAAAQPNLVAPKPTPAVATKKEPVVTPAPAQPAAQPPVQAAEKTPEAKAAEAAARIMANSASQPSNLLPTPSASLGQPAVNLAAEQQQVQQKASQAATGANPQYTGEPISVNLKDVDLKDFFRLIHEISGLNIVLDPNVRGSLTLVLDDVPWDQALDIVLQNNGLDKRLEGNVLRIATRDTFTKEAEARRAQEEAQALAVAKVQFTHFLSYAHAAEIVPIVKKFLSQRGDVIADPRTNALIITDIPSTLPEVQRVIQQLDRKTQQVEIEARVVAATRNFARDVGVQLGFGWGNGPTAVGGAGVVGTSPLQVTVPNPKYFVTGNAIPLFSNQAAVGGQGNPLSGGISMSNATSSYRVDAILTMAEARGLLKVLSRPRVVTQNNIGATVKQGVRIPTVTAAQLGGPPTTSYTEAALRLQVTPQITVENTIFLNVEVENTTPDFSRQVSGNPSLITQQAQTQVLVNDGGTVVIGGVIQTQNSVSTTQIPLLGDIPVLGNLFKRRAVSTSTQELIFFITPKIVQT
jgi:type IV pilus assembly protein PilQ